MGVNGLLPCLKSITRSVPLERYRGLTAAVDAMSWLHKGVFACDVKTLALCQRNNSDQCGSAELRCVKYAMTKAELLQAKFGIKVLLIIDGDSLPSKKEENGETCCFLIKVCILSPFVSSHFYNALIGSKAQKRKRRGLPEGGSCRESW